MGEIKDTKIRASIIGVRDSKGELIKHVVSSVEFPLQDAIKKLCKDSSKYLYVDHITNNNMSRNDINEFKLRVEYEDGEYHFYTVNKDNEIEFEFE